jgi:hypothetical protein
LAQTSQLNRFLPDHEFVFRPSENISPVSYVDDARFTQREVVMLVFESIQARWSASQSKEPVQLGRAKIPGGWLVGRVSGIEINPQTVLCFVPDPDQGRARA